MNISTESKLEIEQLEIDIGVWHGQIRTLTEYIKACELRIIQSQDKINNLLQNEDKNNEKT